MNIHIEADGDNVEKKGEESRELVTESRQTFVKCTETDDQLNVVVDLPDIDAKSLDVTLTGRKLIVKSETESEDRTEENGVERIVKRRESFMKEVMLPSDVDPESTDAVYKRGALHVKLRKLSGDSDRGERVVVKVE